VNWWARWRKWATPGQLRAAGVLGINARNADFVRMHNPRRLYPRVDDKLKTKRIAEACGIAVPRTYTVIERFGDLSRLADLTATHREFVIKPARGAGGRGIVVIASHDADVFRTPSGHAIELDDLRYHISTILSGLYSLGGHTDVAIIEQRIVRHPVFDDVAVGGTPDIRIIVYRGEPIMAMIRLPTNASRGRANLHQGAIGAGIDMPTGTTTGGVCRNHAIDRHPDTGASIVGMTIPGWHDLLDAARRLAAGIEMGYIGVDFVIDASHGPVMLEANARPGLAIQIANRRGIRSRFDGCHQ